jgi:cytochrome c biogenesis protein CcmG/thiol:disulfide interchange protein DsbE
MTEYPKSHPPHGLSPLTLALIGGGMILLGLAAYSFWVNPSDSGTSNELSAIPVEVNFPAPELALTDLQGNPASLDDLRGQVVLVNNWATWCPPCKAEMPTLETYYQKHHAQGFTIIAIEAGDSVANVSSFVKSYALTFPVWLDPDNQALTAFRNPGLPNSYLINRAGIVRLAWTGWISQSVLEKYVTPIIEKD